jgi:hypothetical protein
VVRTQTGVHVHSPGGNVNDLPEDRRLPMPEYGGWVEQRIMRAACRCGVHIQLFGEWSWLPTLPTADDLVAFAEWFDLDSVHYDGTIVAWQFDADMYHPECIRQAAGILPGVGPMDDDVEYAVAYVAWLRGIDLSEGDPCSQTFPVPIHNETELWMDPRDFDEDDEDYPEEGKPQSCGACFKPLPESAR